LNEQRESKPLKTSLAFIGGGCPARSDLLESGAIQAEYRAPREKKIFREPFRQVLAHDGVESDELTNANEPNRIYS
jgi:hypothetical protein